MEERLDRMDVEGERTPTARPRTNGATESLSNMGGARMELAVGEGGGPPFRVKQWKVGTWKSVRAGQVVATVCDAGGSAGDAEVRAPTAGILSEIRVRTGESAPAGSVIGVLEACLHKTRFMGLCSDCGKDLSSQTIYDEDSVKSVAVPYSEHKITTTADVLERVEVGRVAHMQRIRKLNLVLDLDHTLLECTTNPEIDLLFQSPYQRRVHAMQTLAAACASNPSCSPLDVLSPSAVYDRTVDFCRSELVGDLHRFTLRGSLNGSVHYILLRPGLERFLSEAATAYVLHVYTHGTKDYAQLIASVIDPEGKYFHHRILSRDDVDHELSVKTLSAVFPVDDSMVAIVDDRFDIWKACPNLIRIEPFRAYVPAGQAPERWTVAKKQLRGLKRPLPIWVDDPADMHGKPEAHGAGPGIVTGAKRECEASAGAGAGQDMEVHEGVAKEHEGVAKEGERKEQEEETSIQPQEGAKHVAIHARESPEVPRERAAVDEGDGEGSGAAQEVTSDGARRPCNVVTADAAESGGNEQGNASCAVDDGEEEVAVRMGVRREALRDKHLDYVLHSVLELHRQYFAAYDSGNGADDAKFLLYRVRMQVLRGVHIVFSGVHPLGSNPETSRIWMLTESFGAFCHRDINEEVTHVVAANDNSSKVKQARSQGLHVVGMNWLLDSLSAWHRMDEAGYVVEKGYSSAPGAHDRFIAQLFDSYHNGVDRLGPELEELLYADEEEFVRPNGAFGSLDDDLEDEDDEDEAGEDADDDGLESDGTSFELDSDSSEEELEHRAKRRKLDESEELMRFLEEGMLQ